MLKQIEREKKSNQTRLLIATGFQGKSKIINPVWLKSKLTRNKAIKGKLRRTGLFAMIQKRELGTSIKATRNHVSVKGEY